MYELGQTCESSIPMFGERTYALHIPGGPTYREPFGRNQLIGNDEFLCTEVGQVGTQFDSLVKDGVHEFLFVFAPVPFKGATGSPGRPIAIR